MSSPRKQIVLGPPGTGKTTTMIRRVEEALARGAAPDRVGYFAFTRKAANEALGRACEKFELTREDLPYFSTIHSMCFRQLGMRRSDVLEGERLAEFARYAGIKASGRIAEDGNWSGADTGDRILFMENLSRIRKIPLREAYDVGGDDGLPWQEVERVSRALADYKEAKGLTDFTDMLKKFVDTRVSLHLTDLFVDEVQDLSPLQWDVVEALAEGCENVHVAGDDDQAIYRWAGADVNRMIDMDGDVVVLGQSYRVPPVIQRVANGVIDRVHHRRAKAWKARAGGEGEVDRARSFDKVDCGSGQILVLARNVYVLREQVEPQLRQQGIIYEKNGHSSVSTKLLEAIMIWESLRRGEKVTVAQARIAYAQMTAGRGYKRGFKSVDTERWSDDAEVTIVDLMKRGGLMTKAPWFEALDKTAHGDMEYVRAALARGEKISKKPRVVISTIHGAKGGEADHVVLLKEIAGRTWREMQDNPDDERRVWYVGATRAKEKLTIVEGRTMRSCPWL